MKQYFSIRLFVVVFGMVLLLYFLPDHTAAAGIPSITVQNIKLDKKEAKVGDTVELSMDADSSSGPLERLVVSFKGTDYESYMNHDVDLMKDPANPTRWHAKINLTEDFAKGNLKISMVRYYFHVNDYILYNQALYPDANNTSDLSGGDFFVDPAGYQPELTSISVDKKQGQTGDLLTYSFSAKGLHEDSTNTIQVFFRSPLGDQQKDFWRDFQKSGTSFEFRIGPNDQKGIWKVDRIRLTDKKTGNTIIYYNQLFYDKATGRDFSQIEFEVMHPNGWVKINTNWYYFNPVTGEKVKGWFQDQGFQYYLDESGRRYSGFLDFEGHEYYFYENGTMATGWVYDDWYGDNYYFDNNGRMLTGIQWIDGDWYAFNEDGAMVTGWYQEKGKQYYFDEEGIAHSGWVLLGNVWYFFGEKGEAVTGWKLYEGKWYFIRDGRMLTGITEIGYATYYLNKNGEMETGWKLAGGKWYYFKPVSGNAVTGWFQEGKVWYYFDTKGVMAAGWKQIAYTNQKVWFYFDQNGAMQTGWKLLGGKWYYLESSGVMVTNLKTIGGITYYFKADGSMAVNEWIQFGQGGIWRYYLASGQCATGWQTINGMRYYFNNQGVWQK